MMRKRSKRKGAGKLRPGIPNDHAEFFLPKMIASFAHNDTGMTFDVVCEDHVPGLGVGAPAFSEV